jgi:2-dehydropantoate 2-reductase
MRIAVVGAGALGLFYGAMLQRAGNDVRFLLRGDFPAIRERGLEVRSINGDFHLREVQGYRTTADIGPVDLVLVGLKTFDNHLLGELIPPLLGPETRILTLQNGIGNEEALAALFGAERVLGGVAFLCSNRGEPGVVHHLGAGRITLGEFKPHDHAVAERVAALFGTAGVECLAVHDLKKARWEKLVWNIPFNGLCALTGRAVDILLRNGDCQTLVHDIMIEVIRAGNAQELSEETPDSFAGQMIALTETMGPYRPSMLIDREEGRPLELDAIMAKPLARGRERGVAMPKTAMLYTLLATAVEAG